MRTLKFFIKCGASIVFLAVVLFSISSSRADVLWQVHNPLPKIATLDRLQIDDQGRMVALYGNATGLATSTNGTNWVWERTANPFTPIRSIAYGNGKWVVINQATNNPNHTMAQVSTDLKNWTRTEISTPSLFKQMTFGNGKFWLAEVTNVAPAATYTSTNGQDWTLLPNSNLPFWELNTLAYDETNHLLIAGGKNGNITSFKGCLATSPDGVNWTVRYIRSETNSLFTHIRSAGGVDLACGNGPYPLLISSNLYRSTDGVTWTAVTVPNNSFDYFYLGSYLTNWVCWDGSSGSYIVSSNSGLTWVGKSTGSGSPNGPISGVYRTNDSRWYAVGGNGTVVYTTNFSGSWSNVQVGTKGQFKGLAAGTDGRLVAVSDDGTIYSSPEGTNWSKVATGSSDYYGVWNFNGTFMALSTTARVWLSTNGVDFTNYANPQSVIGAMWDGTKIIGWRNSGGTNFFTTTTGTNWTAITNSVVPVTRNGRLYKFDSQYLYVDGTSPPMNCLSSDLIHWTTNGVQGYFNSFAYGLVEAGGKLFYAYAGGILISSNGLNWTNVALYTQPIYPGNVPLISITNRLYSMTAVGSLIYSDTGTNWTMSPVTIDRAPGSGINFKMLYTGQRLVIVGEQGNIASLSTALEGGVPTVSGLDFATWAAQYSFPPGLSDPEDDADSDGISNAAEFAFGSNPVSGSSKPVSQGILVNVAGVNYPSVTYVRNKNATGVTINVAAATDVQFASSTGLTEVGPRVDLGNGLEQVTMRANQPLSTYADVFFKLNASVP